MSEDSKRNAKAEGKRISASGNIYYESRPDHSDKVTTKAKKQLEAKKKTTKSKNVISKFSQGLVKKLENLAKKGKAV